MQLDAEDSSKGSLELNPMWVAMNRKLTVGRKGTWWEVPVDAKLGTTYSGRQLGTRACCWAVELIASCISARAKVDLAGALCDT